MAHPNGANGLVGITVAGSRFAITSAQIRGNDDEGTHHLAFSGGIVQMLYTQEQGQAEASRAFSCSQLPMPARSQRAPIVRADIATPGAPLLSSAVFPPTLLAAAAPVIADAAKWNDEFVALVATRLRGSQRTAWTTAIRGALAPFDVNVALINRMSSGKVVLPEDLYPGVDAQFVVAKWILDDWATATLGRLMEVIATGNLSLDPAERVMILEQIEAMRARLN